MTTLPVQALVNQRWTDSQPAIWERSEGGAGGRAGGRPTDPVALGSVAIRRLTALHRMDNKCATTLEPWTNQPTNQPTTSTCRSLLPAHATAARCHDWRPVKIPRTFSWHTGQADAYSPRPFAPPAFCCHDATTFSVFSASWPLSVSLSLFSFAVIFLIHLVSGTILPLTGKDDGCVSASGRLSRIIHLPPDFRTEA
jgi:hypothetical protein